ncbi:MAG: 50S ribosomal protein L19 [SAR202 cluster bacterium]|nr:50S ribosomal protein L19 [SAR202 cluster bacterium]
MADAHHLSNHKPNAGVGEFREGDTVRVAFRIQEGERTRTQSFQGVVIRKGGAGPAASFTVRRMAFDTGIERIFPIHSPLIESVSVIRYGRTRRAKLYYLRERAGRAARVKERRVAGLAAPEATPTPPPLSDAASAPAEPPPAST